MKRNAPATGSRHVRGAKSSRNRRKSDAAIRLASHVVSHAHLRTADPSIQLLPASPEGSESVQPCFLPLLLLLGLWGASRAGRRGGDPPAGNPFTGPMGGFGVPGAGFGGWPGMGFGGDVPGPGFGMPGPDAGWGRRALRQPAAPGDGGWGGPGNWSMWF